MFEKPFNYALATRILTVCLFLIVICTIAIVALFKPIEGQGAAPSTATVGIKKIHVVSLYQYVKQKPLTPTFDSLIWDAFTLASPTQREQLDRGFPEQAVVFRGYAIAEDKDKWFTNEGIIVMQVFTEPLSVGVPTTTNAPRF